MTEDEHHSPAQEERNRRVDLEIENSRMAMLDAGPRPFIEPAGEDYDSHDEGEEIVYGPDGNLYILSHSALDALLAQAREEGRIAGLREAADSAKAQAEHYRKMRDGHRLETAFDREFRQSCYDKAVGCDAAAKTVLSLIPAGVEKEAGE